MFGNEVRPISPTSPTAEQLQFLFIMSEMLRFTMHNLYINTIVQITTSPSHNKLWYPLWTLNFSLSSSTDLSFNSYHFENLDKCSICSFFIARDLKLKPYCRQLEAKMASFHKLHSILLLHPNLQHMVATFSFIGFL